MRNSILSAILVAMITGCAVGPTYKRPADCLPENYTEESIDRPTEPTDTLLGEAQHFDVKLDLPAQWWELFKSPALNELVQACLENNPSVESAQAALKIAVENVYAQEGVYYPQVSASFTPTRQKTSRALASNVANNKYIYNLFTDQISVSYTADVFGLNQRQVESLSALADAEYFMLEATYLTLTSNVVNAAIQEAGLRGQIASTKKIIEIQYRLVNTYRQLYQLGQMAESDIALQEALVAAAEASLPPLEKLLAVQRDLIKTLAGRFPDDSETPTFELESFELPTELPLTLPSSLVNQRPDVRAAEEQLHSACALVGVAIANRFPTITLGANVGAAALTLAGLLKNPNMFWEIAGSLTQPLFTGGTLLHKEASAWATFEQAAAQYRVTVLNAFQNVADSLQAIQIDARALKAATNAERAALRSWTIVGNQLGVGDVSPLIALTTEQTYRQSLLNSVLAQTNRLTDTVALFQSLGGGWWNKNTETK